ncbi:mannose-1-phosphate guanylyltransferase [Flavobacterium psychrotrophum]|uniref:mannose-1-phosphate guanylyltransferase n=1 Tax=Flavobacterium psychrotrophum TaxID=2294119 RepID=UPI000E30E480|nr:sugar phosphate nucleotidyltransferase [Flavobacterium psychrotrophum]
MSKVTHVILTGGVGSRLWPLSRKSRPKQYLPIFGGKSLFEMTAERNQDFADKVIVVGSRDNCHLSKEMMEKNNVTYLDIVEAVPRNTAAAIAFAAFAAEPDDILVVTPSDHIIEGAEAYRQAMDEAISKAKNNFIVTFGVHPTKPETGYGYIEHNGDEVISFREKPNQVTAQTFIDTGNFLWNSGMFCFKASVLLEELKLYQPEIYEKSQAAWSQAKEGRLDEALSMEIPSISIDYAVMERSKKIKVVPAIFKWSDLGSFDSVYEYLAKMGHKVDEFGNMVIGTSNYTAFLGLENTIFVYTEDANLILHKDHSQEVKNVYGKLEKENSILLN